MQEVSNLRNYNEIERNESQENNPEKIRITCQKRFEPSSCAH